MKKLTCIDPGTLLYGAADQPTLTPGYAIIKLMRLGICGTDLHAFEGSQPFFNYPRILGHEIAGELVEVDDAPEFARGEAVTVIPYINCNDCIACRNGKPNCCSSISVLGVHTDGAMVEYLSVPSRLLVHGEGLTFEQLALVEPLAIGAHGVDRANIRAGEFVLVVGAGPIGLATMEFARERGAQVIAMDISDAKLAFCRSKLSITYTVNALDADIYLQISNITNGEMPVVVIDATGNLAAINRSFEYLAHTGRYVLIGLQKESICFSHPQFHKREATLMSSRNATRADFEHAISCIKRGEINPALYITHRIKFEEVASEFNRLLDPASGVIKAMISF